MAYLAATALCATAAEAHLGVIDVRPHLVWFSWRHSVQSLTWRLQLQVDVSLHFLAVMSASAAEPLSVSFEAWEHC